jgi:hypothetical protein
MNCKPPSWWHRNGREGPLASPSRSLCGSRSRLAATRAIADNPEDARRLTIKRNTVAVVADGSAVLGLGNLGEMPALPMMEGKAAAS